MRLYIPTGRILTGATRFGGRVRRKGIQATNPQSVQVPNTAAQARHEIRDTIPVWNPDGSSGRAALDELNRRARGE